MRDLAFSRFMVVGYLTNDTSAMKMPITMKPTPIANDIPL
jgi:hypothetical protein